jgi:hypothetical protein
MGLGKPTFQMVFFGFLYNIYGWWIAIGMAPANDNMKNQKGFLQTVEPEEADEERQAFVSENKNEKEKTPNEK